MLGFLGLLVIFSEDLTALAGDQARRAAGIFLISPVVSAVANVVVKRWGSAMHPLSLTAVPMGFTAATMGALAAVFEQSAPVSFDRVSVGALVYLAAFGTSLTFLLFFWLLQRLPATRLSLITYGVPIVAVVVGTVFLDEPITARIVVGTALVLAGVLLAIRR
jgi:drug/metabolite transporter (DMT)-like permease